MTEPIRPTILLVADDEALVYLIRRYAERSGVTLRVVPTPPSATALRTLGPAVVWFPSLSSLDTFRPRDGGWVGDDAPVVVCASSTEETRARELGADYCAAHPLTYPEFLAALSAVGVATAAPRSGPPIEPPGTHP